MSLKAGETKRCEACGTELVGARTAGGAIAPIVYHPSEDGNTLIFRSGEDGTIEARTFTGDVLKALRDQGVALRLNHFADCPEPGRFKR